MRIAAEAPAQEVAPFGIRVVIVEPGPFRTGFLGRSMAVAHSETPGCDATGRQARLYREGNDGLQPGGPEKAVAIILKAVDQENPPLHLPPGKRAYDLVRVKLGALAEEMDR